MDDDDFAELLKQLKSGSPGGGTSWADVGVELQALSKTLVDGVRAAWRNQAADERIAELQLSLQALIDDLNRQVEDTPEAQRARAQLGQVADTLRRATERASAEVRPQLIDMLRQANAELKRLTGEASE